MGPWPARSRCRWWRCWSEIASGMPLPGNARRSDIVIFFCIAAIAALSVSYAQGGEVANLGRFTTVDLLAMCSEFGL